MPARKEWNRTTIGTTQLKFFAHELRIEWDCERNLQTLWESLESNIGINLDLIDFYQHRHTSSAPVLSWRAPSTA
jgi:hypothetical protein